MTTYDGTFDVADDDAPPALVQRCADRVRHFWREVNGDNLPFYLPSIVSIGFGVVLMLPVNTFSSGASFAFMDYMARRIGLAGWGELVWGLLFVAAGAWHVGFLYVRHPYCHIARDAVVAVWLFVCGTFAFSFLASTGIVAYGGYVWLGRWGRNRVRPYR